MDALLHGDSTFYLPYLIPLCGVCLLVYWTSTDQVLSDQNDDHKLKYRRLVIVPLCFALWFESGGIAFAQGTTTTTNPHSDFPTITRMMAGVPVQLPDWKQISLDSLGRMSEPGQVTIPPEIARDLGFKQLHWKAGDKLSDVLPMGALSECLGLDQLTQGVIDQVTGQVTSYFSLNKFALINLQSLGSMIEAVPELGDFQVGNVLPMQDLLEQAIGSLPSGNLTVPGLQDFLNQSGDINTSIQIVDQTGNVIGILKEGNVVDTAGSVVGSLDRDGNVTNATGQITGIVNQSGQIVDQSGQVLGAVRSTTQLPTSLTQMLLKDVVKQFPELGQLGMNNLNLEQYTFSQIPGLENAPIGDFLDWQTVSIAGIPGLGKVPFSQFPNPLVEGTDPFVARVDVPLDAQEAQHTHQNTVSGSYQAGFRVPCEQNCAQAELSPIGGSQMAAGIGIFANGKSWISGKHQEVEGGEGVLKMVNGGKEPTGRNPYCSVFKQVITTVDAPGGKIGTSMYFRFCKRKPVDLGCTPYFLGPIPFLSYHEKQFIFLGDSNAKDDGQGITLSKQDDPLSSQDGFRDCGSKLLGAATASATKAVDKVARSVKDGAFQATSAQSKDDIERIMAEAQLQGVTCPAQIAAMLATAGAESSYGANMGEFADTAMISSGGTPYYGRGYVGLTHRDNYSKATKYLRSQGMNVDLVANPNLASRPDIAAKILVWGMRTGAFTGSKLNDYVNCNGRVDFYGMRNIVNPGEYGSRRAAIAKAAQIYYDALKDQDLARDKATTDKCSPAKTNPTPPSQPAKTNTAPEPQTTASKPTTPSQPCPPGQRCPLLNPLPHMSSAGIYSRFRRCRPNHNGVDIQSAESPDNYDRGMGSGGPVVAPDDGVVVYAANDGSGYANIVKIYHPQRGISTFMAHLSKIMVSQGQQVKRGQQIGVEGSHGVRGARTYGIHLHFEIHQGAATPGDPYGSRLDPESFEYEKPAIRKPGADLFC